MSRKTQRNRPGPEARSSQSLPGTGGRRNGGRGILFAMAGILLVAIAGGALLYRNAATPSAQPSDATRSTALASLQSPTVGDAGAKVHVVEFLDPACETCAQFFPIVKQRMAENPGKIRLSVRHVAFHQGSDYVVKVLEASRRQDKYWQTLDALLATQSHWAPNHVAEPDRVVAAISGVGLDIARLMADMNAPDVAERMQRDRNDAMALQVTATPEYFVNGRPLPSFGEQQLQDLVTEELRAAY